MNSRRDLTQLPIQAVNAPRGTRPARTHARERFPWGYLAAFLFGTALISTFIWYQIENERQTVLANWQARVTAIAEGRKCARLVDRHLGGGDGRAIQAESADAHFIEAEAQTAGTITTAHRVVGDR